MINAYLKHMVRRYRHKVSLLSLIMIMCSLSAIAQERLLSGTVTTNDGEGLPGVSVLVTGTSTGTTTDLEGRYSLSIPDNATISFSMVGYVTEEIEVGNQSVVDIVLVEDIRQLEELVVIGYGEKSRKLLTESISSIKSEEIRDTPLNTVEGVLQGKTAGVTVRSFTGQPGEQPDIKIRGGSSINKSNEPLYIIDGVQRSSQDFNPQDVESIEVLKDAAATAIYGSRASNGVIIITTKKGTKGKARFNVNYRSDWSNVLNRLDLLNATEYLEIERVGLTRSFLDENSAFGEGANSTGLGNAPDGPNTPRRLQPGESVPAGYLSMTDPVTGDQIIYTDTDWQDVVYRTANTQDLYISADGGSELITYYLGAAYLSQQGIARPTGYERFSVQSNVGFQIHPNLKINTSVNYIRGISDEPQDVGLMFGRNSRMAPTTRYRFDDGTLAPGVRESLQNPQHYTDNYLRDEIRAKLNLGGSIEWDIVEGLKATGTVNFYDENASISSFTKSNFFRRTRPASHWEGTDRTTQFEGTLVYNKSFTDHNLTLMVGASRLQNDYFRFSASGFGGSTDNVQTLNAIATMSDMSSFESQDLLIGYFGRLSYDYKSKYLFSGTLRRDGSSRFGFDNQVGYFPSASVGWRISEEAFLSSSSTISDFKLRASWGQTGNNEVGNSWDLNRFYLSQGVYDPGYLYQGQTGARATDLPNPELGWETTTQIDFGFDLGFFDDKLGVGFDIYQKNTDDLLFTRPLPNTSGFSSIEENIGKVKFSGTEIEIWANDIDLGPVKWNSSFNISFLDNEVVKLPDNGLDRNRIGGEVYEDGTGLGGIAEGERMGGIVGYQFLKVYATTQEAQEDGLMDMIANDRTGSNGINYRERVGGDVKWEDLNGDNIIDERDMKVLGYSTPNIVGGFSNTFTWKGLELYLLMDFAKGHHIVNQHRYRMNSNSQGNINGTSELKDAWNEEGDITDVPRFVFFDFGNANNFHRPDRSAPAGGFIGPSSQMVEKADFLAIRTLRLSYNFGSLLNDVNALQSLKVYVAGQNLHYFTGYKGYNPESNGPLDSGRYPLYRTFSIGLNIGF